MSNTYEYTDYVALVFEPTVNGSNAPILKLVTPAGLQTLGLGDLVIDTIEDIEVDHVDIQFKNSHTHEFHVQAVEGFTWLRRPPPSPTMSCAVREVPSADYAINCVAVVVSAKDKLTGNVVPMPNPQIILIKRRPTL